MAQNPIVQRQNSAPRSNAVPRSRICSRFTAIDSPEQASLLDGVERMRDIQCGSSHPQGGNPMSDDPAVGVVDTQFKVHGTDGLFVCDASVFPSSVDVNPMHTVMALSTLGAERILAAQA